MKIQQNPTAENLENLLKRGTNKNSSKINEIVADILHQIKSQGDKALFELVKNIDHTELTPKTIMVGASEIAEACDKVTDELKNAIELAKQNITLFHQAQKHKEIKVETTAGVECWQRAVPISRVGLYIPAGTAPLFSTVLMLALPAKIAGCKEVILCTPANANGEIAPSVLFAAQLCGVDKIYKIGGAMAIAAMAYGTESVAKVDKIFGPGNAYVTTAKQMVSLFDVAIDMPAGPSEVMVIADDSADAEFVASDLLSQAEHGADSQAILVTTSIDLAQNVLKQVAIQTKKLSRQNIVNEALENSPIIVVDSLEKIIEIANRYAPEHLILAINQPSEIIDKIENAGSVFIGNYTPESAGDYASGTNHTLPTNGWAKSYSGVNLDSFTKKITFQHITKQGLRNIGPAIEHMAQAEGLDAHKNAVTVRLNKI